MRVMLNQRIWRRATSSASAQVAAATLQLSGVRVTSLALSHSTRTLQTAARRSPLRAAPSLLVHTTEPLRCSARVFSVYSASGDPGPAELEKLKKLQDFELGEDPDGTEEPIDEVEAAHLAMLDRAFKGDKNWHVAQDILDMIKDANGDGLTLNIVTALIEVFAIRHRPDECLETLRYTREQGMRPRIHAYSTTIACCYKQLKYLHALRVFEIMRNDGYVPQQVTYSRALSAALKSSQHELVLEIFDDMMRHRVEPSIVTYNSILNSCARNGDVHSALGVLRAVRERNLELTQSSYHSLAICGGKTGHWELARDAYNGLRDAGYTPTMTMYNSVISAYAKGKRWNDIVELYFEMPDDMKGMLHQAYLGAVLMGFAKSENPEIQRKTLEVYEAYKAQGRMHDLNLFAHNAVVMYLLDSNQLDRVHAFAQEMKDNGIEWDGLTYQSVILAYIRAEDIKTAQHLLTKHAKAMQFSTVCYRELIQYFGEQRQDPLTACRLSMQMMQHNARLSRLDWHTALDFALKSGKKAVYWNFRKWMKVRASSLVNDMPAELMLNDEEEPRPKRRAKHQTPRKP